MVELVRWVPAWNLPYRTGSARKAPSWFRVTSRMRVAYRSWILRRDEADGVDADPARAGPGIDVELAQRLQDPVVG